MTRVTTSYYGASLSTQFAWATSGNDLFNREQDLYRLAQALENHDHSSTRGLPVARLADLSILSTMYGNLSIPSTALQNLAVTTGKIADGAVTDAKMANQKVNRAGDTMTGALFVTNTGLGVPGGGTVYLGNTGLTYVYFDGSSMVLQNGAGGLINLVGEARVFRTSDTNVGFMYFGGLGPYVGYDGANLVASYNGATGAIITAANATPAALGVVPIGGVLWFRTNAELVAAGARWVREATPDGRLLVGAGGGALFGASWVEATNYGANWTPTAGLGISNTLAVSGLTSSPDGTNIFLAAAAASNNSAGATNVNTAAHAHAISGGALSGSVSITGSGGQWLPPSLGVIWGRRQS